MRGEYFMKWMLSLLVSLTFFSLACENKGDVNNVAMKNEKPNQQIENGDKKMDNVEPKRKEYEFNGHSPEGGRIFTYYDSNGNLSYFIIDLLGEGSRVTYRFDINNKNDIDVTRKKYTYKSSIAESEGDVEISSQEESKYHLKNGNTIEPPADWIIVLYKDAMKIIDS